MNPLELIRDSASGVWRTLKPEELEEAVEKVPTNRAMRRTAVWLDKIERRSARPSGPGYQSKRKRGTGPRNRLRRHPHRRSRS